MAPIYSEWKTDWELAMEKFEDRCDNCLYAMKNVENEEIRTDKWFRTANSKKKNMLAGIVGSEYILYENEVGVFDLLENNIYYTMFLQTAHSLKIDFLLLESLVNTNRQDTIHSI